MTEKQRQLKKRLEAARKQEELERERLHQEERKAIARAIASCLVGGDGKKELEDFLF